MNQKELKELIEFLIEKDIAEFELERGDVKVRIKRAGEHTVVHSQASRAFMRCPRPRQRAPELGAVPVVAAACTSASRALLPKRGFTW